MRQCVIVDGAFDALEPIVGGLVRAGFAPPTVVPSLARALDVLQVQSSELLILPVSTVVGPERETLEGLLRDATSLAAIGTAPEASAEVVLSTMRAGISEFLLSRASVDELTTAMSRLERRWAMAPVRGSVTAVFCPKGGQGATSIAVNLAHAIARKRGRRVAVVDLVLGLGDVALQLNLRPSYDVGELALKVDRLDRALLESVAASGPDGLAVLAATERLDLAAVLTGDVVASVLAQCRQSYEHTIVDCEHAFEARTVATLDAADQILLVTQLHVSSLVVAKRALGIFRELGYSDEKVRIVLNREGSSNLVSIIEAQKVLGRSIDGRLPNDFAVASEAQSQGVPFLRHAPGAALSKAYDAFATRFIAMVESPADVLQRDAASQASGRRSRLFGLLKR
jgi:pilus assembly protein CpaE